MNAIEYFKAEPEQKAKLWLDPGDMSQSECVSKQTWVIDLLQLLAARRQAYDVVFIKKPTDLDKRHWVGSIVRFLLNGEAKYEIGDWRDSVTNEKSRAIYDFKSDSITILSRTKFAIDHMRPAEFKTEISSNELADYQDKWIVKVYKTYNHPRGFVEFLIHIITPTVVEFYCAYDTNRTKPIVNRQAFSGSDAFKYYEGYHPLSKDEVEFYLSVMEEQDKECKVLDPVIQ